MKLTPQQKLNALGMPITECGCVIWMGLLNAKGYGEIKIKRKGRLAHRVSWECQNGPIPNNLNVLHKCDVRSCINPDHLFLGTQADNMRDAFNKNRIARGNKLPQTKLKTEDILAIRQSGLPGREIAKLFGISEGYVSQIKSYQKRKHT